jgi:hypothetical protein
MVLRALARLFDRNTARSRALRPASTARRTSLAALALAASLGGTGCIKKMLVDGQIESTRKAAAAMQGTADFEVARAASMAGLAQFEGMHYLAPDNQDAYYLLVRNYASAAFAFAEDDLEVAVAAGKDDEVDYQKERAKSLYTRAIGFGVEWMEKKHPGFSDAAKNGLVETMAAYLKQFDDAADADILFWVGQAWMGRANVDKSPELAGTVYVGKSIIERVVALNETVENGNGHVLLGAFDARTGVNTIGEESFQSAKKHFDRAAEINGGKLLLGKVQMAKSYYCRMKDDSPGRRDSFAAYQKALNEVLAADDPLPSARLTNAIAKRKARRYLSKAWIEGPAREDCGWDLSQVVPPPPPAG